MNPKLMTFNSTEMAIIHAALTHWNFKKRAVENPLTRYISQRDYENLVERIEGELKE